MSFYGCSSYANEAALYDEFDIFFCLLFYSLLYAIPYEDDANQCSQCTCNMATIAHDEYAHGTALLVRIGCSLSVISSRVRGSTNSAPGLFVAAVLTAHIRQDLLHAFSTRAVYYNGKSKRSMQLPNRASSSAQKRALVPCFVSTTYNMNWLLIDIRSDTRVPLDWRRHFEWHSFLFFCIARTLSAWKCQLTPLSFHS